MEGSCIEIKSPLSAQPLGNCHPGLQLSCTEQTADKGPLSTHTHSLFQMVLAGSEQKWLNKQLHIPAQKAKKVDAF